LRKIILFCDGSLESKVLEYQLSHPLEPDIGFNIQRIDVKLDKDGKPDLERYFHQIQKLENNHKFDPNIPTLTRNTTKYEVFLHYNGEDFKKYEIEKELNQIREKYPNLTIVCAYQFITRQVVERNAIKYGIKQ
jgi:hypothetical protein